MLKRGKDKGQPDHEEVDALKAQLEDERKITKQLQAAFSELMQKYEDERRYAAQLMEQLKDAGLTPTHRPNRDSSLEYDRPLPGHPSESLSRTATNEKPMERGRSLSAGTSSPRDNEDQVRKIVEILDRRTSSQTLSRPGDISTEATHQSRDGSPTKSSPTVVSQRIAALSRSRGSSVSTTLKGGMPKQLVHTGNQGVVIPGHSPSAASSSPSTGVIPPLAPTGFDRHSPQHSPRTHSGSNSPRTPTGSPRLEPSPSTPDLLANKQNDSDVTYKRDRLTGSLTEVRQTSSGRSGTPPRVPPRSFPHRAGMTVSTSSSPSHSPHVSEASSSNAQSKQPSASSESSRADSIESSSAHSAPHISIHPSTPDSNGSSGRSMSPARPPGGSSPRVGSPAKGRPRFQSESPRPRVSEEDKLEKAQQVKDEMKRNLDATYVLDYQDLFFERQLGKGVSSTVYKGTYRGKEVALKVLRLENQQRDLEDFKKEMEVMVKLNSHFIIKFYGATFEPKLCIVMEYCANGALFQYLQDQSNRIDWPLVLRWAKESAQALLVLHNHQPQIVHRDFKSLNLLLDSNLTIKVCDFGLSRFVQPDDEDKRSTLHTIRGTYAYAAPEVFHKEQYTTKSDVYSFGIVLWELITRAMKGRYTRPFGEFPELVHDFQVLMQATKGVRPSIPPNCPAVLAALVRACWSSRPEDRPSCSDLIILLDVLHKDYDAYRSKWDSVLYNPDLDSKST